ncbi:chromosome segregation and condensation protein ScpA [Pseudogulbenkiania sp. NH8B]|uniref:segregation and condensation protein A n=1 Tax=Pseudogulbenkiania sp. (strain NH8B) TaxID=748280 RepID=UPI000227A2A9|nr:ScpA family protein [Pseudogulbenkiania sp. NH8B]BAK78064.1 chromosome segregation and condensation protein ScpA [Pseudogulbenkiania sp. NH8B]
MDVRTPNDTPAADGASAFELTAPDLPSGMPIAHVFGQPVLEVPQDLFIPPDALQVILESFEGPLDLLLYLIRKQNLNVLDIPMAPITAQYMAYIDAMRREQFELAAEYLLMAALLIEIKSRLLLPRPPRDEEGEPDDPRAELVRRLLEYEQMKLAALELDKMPQADRDFAWLAVLIEQVAEERLPEVCAVDLRQAWLAILSRARNTRHHKVEKDELSVRAQMTWILRYLEGREYVAFEELFDLALGVPHLVVNFIAVLELVKEGLVKVSQDAAYQPIYVRLALV